MGPVRGLASEDGFFTIVQLDKYNYWYIARKKGRKKNDFTLRATVTHSYFILPPFLWYLNNGHRRELRCIF
jgi:hypothetical protein